MGAQRHHPQHVTLKKKVHWGTHCRGCMKVRRAGLVEKENRHYTEMQQSVLGGTKHCTCSSRLLVLLAGVNLKVASDRTKFQTWKQGAWSFQQLEQKCSTERGVQVLWPAHALSSTPVAVTSAASSCPVPQTLACHATGLPAETHVITEPVDFEVPLECGLGIDLLQGAHDGLVKLQADSSGIATLTPLLRQPSQAQLGTKSSHPAPARTSDMILSASSPVIFPSSTKMSRASTRLSPSLDCR